MNLWKLPSIVIAPDIIFTIPGINFPVTNTLLCTWAVILILIALFFFGTRRRALVPSGLQNALEWVIELLLGLVQSIAGKEKGKKFFPLVATIFIFAVIANMIDVIPGVDTLGQVSGAATNSILLFGADSNKLIPWIRPATTDLNLTIAMAIVSVVVTQFFGFSALGAKAHLSKYFNFKALFTRFPMGIIDFVVGLLEIISELGRIISFSFRLFGNIFAGSVLLAVFAFLLPVVADIIFIPFEMFVAIVQALVFALLTLVFMQMATSSHGHAEEEHTISQEAERSTENETVVAQ